MALSAAATYLSKQAPGGEAQLVLDLPIAAATAIYRGGYLAISGGYVTPWTGTGTPCGLARQTVDNSAGAAGAVDCQVELTRTRWVKMDVAGVGAANSGDSVYCASDDLGDLTLTAGSNEAIGEVVGDIDATAGTAIVSLRGLFGVGGAGGGADFDSPAKFNSSLSVVGSFLRRFTVAAKTTTTTLTAAEIVGGMITANQGAAGAATYTTPTGTLLEAALPSGIANGDSVDFYVTNISTNAAEDVTLAGGVGVTAVGDMVVASNAVATDRSEGHFRFVRTGANTFDLYRVG